MLHLPHQSTDEYHMHGTFLNHITTLQMHLLSVHPDCLSVLVRASSAPHELEPAVYSLAKCFQLNLPGQ